MPITERTLRKWRKDALIMRPQFGRDSDGDIPGLRPTIRYYADMVIRMTQELLDQHMLRK